jgi:hypothetical protein
MTDNNNEVLSFRIVNKCEDCPFALGVKLDGWIREVYCFKRST